MQYDKFTTFEVQVTDSIAWVTFDYPPVNIQGLQMLADLDVLADKLWQLVEFHQPSENIMPPVSSSEVVGEGVGARKLNTLDGGGTKSFEAAALNGSIATTVSMLELDLTPAHFKGLSLHVVFMLIPMLHDFRREEHGAILTELTSIIDSGALRPLLDEQQFLLPQVGHAYDRLTSGQAIGKVVVEI